MKFRAGKIKREHSVVPSIEPFLARLEQCPDIQAIIPGEIAHSPSPSQPALSFQRLTEQGLRLLGKGGGAVQEVWVITAEPNAVLAWLREQGVIPSEPAPRAKTGPPREGAPLRLTADEPCAVCGRPMRAGTSVWAVGAGRQQRRMHRWCARKESGAGRK